MDQKMMDRVRALEMRREAGESVPELDTLYRQIDMGQQKGYNTVKPPARPASMPASMPKRMAKGGSASKRADGVAQRGKTKGRFV